MEKLLSMPVGGGVAVSADAAPVGGTTAPAEEKKGIYIFYNILYYILYYIII